MGIVQNDSVQVMRADKPGWLKVIGRQKQNKRSRAQPWITHRLLLILSAQTWKWGSQKLRNRRCPELLSHNFYCNCAMVTLKKNILLIPRPHPAVCQCFPAAADGAVSCGDFLGAFRLLGANIGARCELARDVADSFYPRPPAAVSGMRYQVASSKQLKLVCSTRQWAHCTARAFQAYFTPIQDPEAATVWCHYSPKVARSFYSNVFN